MSIGDIENVHTGAIWVEHPWFEYDYTWNGYRVREHGQGRWLLIGPLSGIYPSCGDAQVAAEEHAEEQEKEA